MFTGELVKSQFNQEGQSMRTFYAENSTGIFFTYERRTRQIRHNTSEKKKKQLKLKERDVNKNYNEKTKNIKYIYIDFKKIASANAKYILHMYVY